MATCLGQEERAAQVDAENPVEVFGPDIQHVAPDLAGHSGVLDKGVEGALIGFDRGQKRRGMATRSARSWRVVAGLGSQNGKSLADAGIVGGRAGGNGEAEALGGKGLRDAEADALLASGDRARGASWQVLCDVVGGAQREGRDGQRGVHGGGGGQETDASTMKRLSRSWRGMRYRSTTEVAGSAPIRVVPHWCEGAPVESRATG